MRKNSNPRLHFSFAFILLLVGLSGCATSRPEMNDLLDVKSPNSKLVISEDLCYSIPLPEGKSAFGCLGKGEYVLVKQNSLGKFYKAPNMDVYALTKFEWIAGYGGVWIPDDAKLEVKRYVYYGLPTVTAKTKEELFAKKEPRQADIPVEGPNSITTNLLINNAIPQNMPILQAGLAAAVAGTVVSALVGDVYDYPVPNDSCGLEMSNAVRASIQPITAETPKP